MHLIDHSLENFFKGVTTANLDIDTAIGLLKKLQKLYTSFVGEYRRSVPKGEASPNLKLLYENFQPCDKIRDAIKELRAS